MALERVAACRDDCECLHRDRLQCLMVLMVMIVTTQATREDVIVASIQISGSSFAFKPPVRMTYSRTARCGGTAHARRTGRLPSNLELVLESVVLPNAGPLAQLAEQLTLNQ